MQEECHMLCPQGQSLRLGVPNRANITPNILEICGASGWYCFLFQAKPEMYLLSLSVRYQHY